MNTWGSSWGSSWGASWGFDASVETAAPAASGPDSATEDYWAHSAKERERIRKQNDLIMLTVIAAVTGGMLR